MTYRRPRTCGRGPAEDCGPRQGHALATSGERSKPKKQLFYQVVLGAIRMTSHERALLSVFVDKNQDLPRVAGLAALATVTLDKAGVPVAEGEATAISSFAWDFPSPYAVTWSASVDGRRRNEAERDAGPTHPQLRRRREAWFPSTGARSGRRSTGSSSELGLHPEPR